MIRMPWMRKASSSSEILGSLAKFTSPGVAEPGWGPRFIIIKSKSLYNTYCVAGHGRSASHRLVTQMMALGQTAQVTCPGPPKESKWRAGLGSQSPSCLSPMPVLTPTLVEKDADGARKRMS